MTVYIDPFITMWCTEKKDSSNCFDYPCTNSSNVIYRFSKNM